jgi:hypothetical protein
MRIGPVRRAVTVAASVSAVIGTATFAAANGFRHPGQPSLRSCATV